ncbi:MAG: A24 family peptidase [Kordiimonas sp.]
MRLELTRFGMIIAIVMLLPFALFFTSEAPFGPSLVLYFCLFSLSLFDFLTYRLPNLLTLVLSLTGLLYIYTFVVYGAGDHLVGGLVGLLFFPVLNVGYKALRGKDGIGMGDAKLLAGIGLWLGWTALPIVLFMSSVGGLIYAFIAQAVKNDTIPVAKIPFGPFLCFGCWIAWLYF